MLGKIRNTLKNYAPRDLDKRANAAVLIPIFEHSGSAGLVLILRAEETGPHSGQMGFPGGMAERQDNGDLLRTALRESEEELGISPGDVEIIGELAQRRTIVSDLTVKPYVGIIPYPYDFTPDPREVQGAYMTDLNDLAGGVLTGPGNRFRLPPPVYPVQGKPVWGLTGKMIRELLEAIKI